MKNSNFKKSPMANVDLFAMKKIGKAIKFLDGFLLSKNSVGTQENVKRIDEARNNLINVLFSSGYEFQRVTYKIIKNKNK